MSDERHATRLSDWIADLVGTYEVEAMKLRGDAFAEWCEKKARTLPSAVEASDPLAPYVRVPLLLVEFLLGKRSFNGLNFGERGGGMPPFWWRNYLKDLPIEPAPPSSIAASAPVAWWLTGDPNEEDCLFLSEKWARDTWEARQKRGGTQKLIPLCKQSATGETTK